ncbi:hypothetical protein F7Q93_07340 [Brucella pituitosa]|uniref:DNA-binding protein n=1 Tax=Brucella pituitosa TaxID=571256 RepID=A0A643F4E0_9HYPH|nr:hypothetical protein F7Q93_07340 [Brucella pituitosa]
MVSATLNIKVPPRRLLKPRDAAEYCGLPVKHFMGMCTVVQIDMPNGDRLYDMHDLDAWIDALKTGGNSDDDRLLERLG